MSSKYSKPIQLTQQFRFCSNPFRIDLYKGCDYGCKYCFANDVNFKFKENYCKCVEFKELEKLFYKALETDIESKDVNIELIRHRVPLHCGGMSDPFQTREWTMKLTYKLIQLSNKYNYPICFSTKTAHLPKEYYDILNPELHAFQISILGWSDEYVKKYETNTPTSPKRLAFVKELRDKGFWCSIRIQPLININEAELLVKQAGNIPSYITVEHLKVSNRNKRLRDLLFSCIEERSQMKIGMRSIEFDTLIKIENINRIKQIAHSNGVEVGVGDNELHYLTDGKTCCGIERIGNNFNNYLKYNSTYLNATNFNLDNVYIPKCNVRTSFNGNVHPETMKLDYKQMVDEYMYKYPNLLPNIEKYSKKQKRLF